MYFIWLFIVTAFWTIIFGIAVILSSPFDFKNGKILGYIVRCWAKTIFKTMGIKIETTGLKNLEISKNFESLFEESKQHFDFEKITNTLLVNGIKLFQESYKSVLDTIDQKISKLIINIKFFLSQLKLVLL